MPLPSLNHLLGKAAATFKRFPLTLVDSIFGTVCLFLYLQSEKGSNSNQGITEWEKLAATALLGLPVFFAIELFLERRGDKLGSSDHNESRRKRPSARIMFYFIALILLGFFHLNFSGSSADGLQLLVLFVAAHLIVSFVAYLKRNETNGFWQLNKVMFLRILVAVLYTLVLQLGLSLALGAIDVLFGADVASESYAQIGVILFGIFNTWFFLAGIPYSLGTQDLRTDYPKGLKIFTQFVLLPLVTIYLAILYPYAVKLLIESNLPKGWVSNPVLWFSVVGILSFLLLYPIRNESGNDWIRKFSQYFFIALVPLLALPALGIYTRVRDYGITEERYFVILLVIWLLGISLYFILSRKKDIRLIPITLAAITIVGAVGPASAFTISRISQLSRLEFYLNKYNLLDKNRDITKQATIPENDAKEIASISRYFYWQKKENILENWLRLRVPQGVTIKKVDHDVNLATLLNFKPHTPYVDQIEPVPSFAGRRTIVPVTGYDYYVPFSLEREYGFNNDTVFTIGALSVTQSPSKREVFIAHGRDSLRVNYVDIVRELRLRRDNLVRSGSTEEFDPSVTRGIGRLRLLFAFNNMTFSQFAEDTVSVNEQSTYHELRGSGALFINIINPK